MSITVFERYREQVVNCPSIEWEKLNSPCHDIIRKDWTTLLGWGNPNATIVFVGLNPHLTAGAKSWHQPPPGVDPLDHARQLSETKESSARHFAYHRRILRELAGKGAQVPKSIGEFAFFTEVAFCPSTTQGGLKKEVISQCFRKNGKSFILNSPFKVVIALGQKASEVCVRSFIENEEFEGFSHGRVYEIPNSDKVLLTSYHPNARGKWDRSAVASALYNLYSEGHLSFN
jgi:uracil-DNA glycosylase